MTVKCEMGFEPLTMELTSKVLIAELPLWNLASLFNTILPVSAFCHTVKQPGCDKDMTEYQAG